jgi:hypothetical protein
VDWQVRWQAIDGSSDIKHPFVMATLCSKKWFHSNANQNELAIYSLQCICLMFYILPNLNVHSIVHRIQCTIFLWLQFNSSLQDSSIELKHPSFWLQPFVHKGHTEHMALHLIVLCYFLPCKAFQDFRNVPIELYADCMVSCANVNQICGWVCTHQNNTVM